jgi:hypothetical protein
MTFSVGAKILGIAIAVGLDVLSLSIAVGVMRIRWAARVRLGLAFSAAEVLMQVAGYSIGTGAGRIVGTITIYVGFAVPPHSPGRNALHFQSLIRLRFTGSRWQALARRSFR